MHHNVRVTDEQVGAANFHGIYVVPQFEIVVSVNWIGDPAEVAAAVEAAASTALRQINATGKDTP